VHPKGKAVKAPFFDTLGFPLWLFGINIPITIRFMDMLLSAGLLNGCKSGGQVDTSYGKEKPSLFGDKVVRFVRNRL
jgi:hypothetical protein